MNIIPLIIGIALIIGFGQLLITVAQSRKRKYQKLKFFGLLALPQILLLIIYYPTYYVFVTNNLLFSYIIAILSIAYTAGWAWTLYKVAGEGKIRWFYAILLINVLFLFYLFVENE